MASRSRMKSFIELLQDHFARSKMSYRDLAARLGQSSHTYVGEFLNAKRPLPIDSVERWAEILIPDEEQRKEFYRAAIRDLLPGFVHAYFAEHERRLKDLDRQVTMLKERIVERFVNEPARPVNPAGG